MPDPDTKPDYPHAKPTPEPSPHHVVYQQPELPNLRNGDRIRCTRGDRFISEGQEGLVTNVEPPRFNRPARARVIWDNQCVSIIAAADIEALPKEGAA